MRQPGDIADPLTEALRNGAHALMLAETGVMRRELEQRPARPSAD